MKKKHFAVIAFVVLGALAFTRPALATAVFGGPDCGNWIKEPTPSRKSWLLGFLSGLNVLHDELNRKPDDPLDQIGSSQQIVLWMDNYCQANPLERVATGGWALFEELKSKRSR